MFSQTLIVYASKYGSTKEISERIANVLKAQGISTTLKAAREVTAIDAYDAVIVGSALYGGTWLPEASEFLERFQAELAKKEVWIFSSGPATDDDPVTVLGGWKIPEQLKHILTVIKPQAIALFSGKIDAAKLSSEDYLVSSSLRGVSGDYRNWQTVEGWAKEIAFTLTQAVAAGGTS